MEASISQDRTHHRILEEICKCNYISPQLHQKAALLAKSENKSLNNFVAESIRERIIKETGSQV